MLFLSDGIKQLWSVTKETLLRESKLPEKSQILREAGFIASLKENVEKVKEDL